jgi:uncharacterized membrane protein
VAADLAAAVAAGFPVVVVILVVGELLVTGKSRLSRLWRHWLTFDSAATNAFPVSLFSEIEAAVAKAEQHHHCEIAFAVEASLKTREVWSGLTARQRAQRLFGTLGVWDTELNSGVFLYVLMADRSVEFVTDRGIKARLPDSVWQPLVADLAASYHKGEYRHSTLKFIDLVSKQLDQAFGTSGKPLHVSAAPGAVNPNELSNRPLHIKGD